jgi:hypothetical protein
MHPFHLVHLIFGLFLTISILVLAVGLYALPTIIAIKRDHPYKWPIFAVNILVGCTGIGYVSALVWSLWPRAQAPVATGTTSETL